MKKQKTNKEFKKFRALLLHETNESYKSYQQAKKAYEHTLRSFIIREISGKKGFAEARSESLRMTLGLYENEPWFRIVGDLEVDIHVLQQLIDSHELDLLNPEESELV
jgi:hypothetical protein